MAKEENRDPVRENIEESRPQVETRITERARGLRGAGAGVPRAEMPEPAADYNIQIHPGFVGFAVTVGCRQIFTNNRERLTQLFGEYFRDPHNTLIKYQEHPELLKL